MSQKKIRICFNFQLISKRNTLKRANWIFFWLNIDSKHIAIFHLWEKATSLLKAFSPAMFCKINIIIKKKTLYGYISKTKTNLESKLRFSESSFSFLQNGVFFCALYPRRYSNRGLCHLQPLEVPALTGLMRQKKT